MNRNHLHHPRGRIRPYTGPLVPLSTWLRRPIDGLQLEIIRHRTSLEHYFIAPDHLLRVPTVLARLTILFVVFPETDYQSRNDHGRVVFG